VKTTSLSRVLNNLESLGFIYRETSDTDKRSVKVYLTDLGREKRKVAKDVVREFNEYLNTSFSEKEKATLVKFLKKINEVATNYSPEVQIEP
jgi:DNA-binding MarR family transcriptional regulator